MDEDLPGELLALGSGAGLDLVGISSAEPFAETRRTLEERKAAGLHGGMRFTYGDPSRSSDPGRALPGARALVVGARTYGRAGDGPGSGVGGRPRGVVARYSWADHYAPLRAGLETIAARLRVEGFGARVLCDDNGLVDRAAAERAGLGFFGKNSLLLLGDRGSWFLLGSVVTDAPLAEGIEAVPRDRAQGCGTCRRCLQACPTGALVADGVLDARRCLAWLLEAPGTFPPEHREALGGRVYGCDDCQTACPINRRADRDSPPPGAGPGEEPTVDLLELLGSSDEELLARFGRWYIPRRQARYLRRNALVALGNVAEGADPGVAGALGRALADPDPLIRGHAVWAAVRLGRTDLADGLAASETDPGVLLELAGR